MGQSRSSYLLKNTAIFTLGNLATKVISFFLVPLYTNVLTTHEYGVVDLVTTVAMVAIPVLTLNISESVMRFNLDQGANQDRITKIGMTILLGTIVIGLLLIPGCNLFSEFSGLGVFVYFYCITSAASQIFLANLRGKELLVQYSVGNVLHTLLIAVFNIVFLLGFKWGIKGYLLAYILANAMIAFYALVAGKGYKAVRARIEKKKLKEMLRYSIALIPNSFMWWIMNSSDHLMVAGMIGVAANGIYVISYKLPNLISTLIGIFNQAWGYSAIKEKNARDAEEYSNSVFRSLIAITMIVGVGMMTFIKPFLKFYVSEDFFVAWKCTPFLIVGCVFMTFGTFMGTSYTVYKDSKGFVFSGMFGAALNIFLNLILIPRIGTVGAALATCASYIAVFIFRAIDTRKYLKYQIFTKEFFIGDICLISSGFLMYGEQRLCQIIQLLILCVLLFLFRDHWLRVIDVVLNRRKRSNLHE